MKSIIYSILIGGYDIEAKEFHRDIDSDSGQEVFFETTGQVRDAVARMLQYAPGSAEYDIRFANDTVLVLSILKRVDGGYWKPVDKNVYVSSYDRDHLDEIVPFLKGKNVVVIEKDSLPTTREEVVPLTLEAACELQSARRMGYITKKYGRERWRVVLLAGTDTYLIHNSEGFHEEAAIDETVMKNFVVHYVIEIPGIPENLTGRLRFEYKGVTFIPAGQFKDFGIPEKERNLYEISKHLYCSETKPLLPVWNYEEFYKTAPEEAKENDVFWVVEKGVYMCPGNRPFEFKK